MKKAKVIFNKVLTVLLVFLLIENAYVPLISSAHAERQVSSIQLTTNGDLAAHAFGDKNYHSNYYKRIAIQVMATFSDGTTSNVSSEATYASTDDEIVVTPNGNVTANASTTGSIIVTYQNKQAMLEINSFWDYVSDSYVLNVLNQPTYADITVSNVIFHDANLEKAVRKQLNKPIGTITDADMQQLISLEADFQNIHDLSGLQFATNLEELNLVGNQINNLSSLQSLSNLKSIRIEENQVTDLAALSGLTNLTELFIGENQLTSLQGVQNLTNLNTIDIHGNGVTNLEPLVGLMALQTLNLKNNKIDDLAPLNGLISLSEIDLSHNKISNIQVLNNLSQLKAVTIKGNTLSSDSLSVLLQLENSGVSVEYVDYDPATIEFEDPNLEKALSEYLDIPAPLKNGDLRDIQILDLSNKGITSIKGLENATELTQVNLSSNLITNIDVLLSLSQLTDVNISRNPISAESLLTIQTLEDSINSVYVSYDLDYDPTPVEFADATLEAAIKDMYDLPSAVTKGDLSKLDYLFLVDEKVTSLKGLEYATNLIGLLVSRNNLTSIEELKNLPLLQSVDITKNPIDVSEGSEAITLIQELEARGVTVEYDVDFDGTPIDIADPNLSYYLADSLPIQLTKGDVKQIESLSLSSLRISTLRGIENATSVKSLYLNDNQITDIAPLASMSQLTDLQLRNNDITDLSPLLNLSNLRYLDIRNNLFDATTGSSAREIISSLEKRGVVVTFSETSDTIIKGKVVDENGPITAYSYISGSGNSKWFRTNWETDGDFSLKLGDGIYNVTDITVFSVYPVTYSINQRFEIRNGKLYVNGELKESLEVKLLPTSVTGSLKDETGSLLPYTQIEVHKNDKTFSTTTDQNGQFKFSLTDGNYSVWVYDSAENQGIWLNNHFDIIGGKVYVNGELIDQLDFKLPPVSINGSLVDGTGVPQPEAYLTIEGNNQNYSVKTDSEGHFKYRLSDGNYRISYLQLDSSEGISLSIPFDIIGGKLSINGELKEQLTVTLPLVSLSGSVVDENGSPLANADIYFEGNNQSYSIRSDIDGKFSYRLDDGTYHLYNVKFGNELAPQDLTFKIKDGKLYVNGEISNGLEIKLLPVTVPGSVVYENGFPVANAYVSIDSKSRGYSVYTDAQGKFNVRLADGLYTIYYLWNGNENIPLNIPFEIIEGKLFINGEQKEQLEVKLPPVSLTGSVIDENGIPVPDAGVNIFSNNQNYGTSTNSQGKFTMRLSDGSYTLASISYGGATAPQNIAFEIKDGKLYINGEQKAQLEIKLLPVTLKGIVVTEDGSPVSNAYVLFRSNNPSFGVPTDNQGNFNARLADGSYTIYFMWNGNEGISLNIPIEIRDGKLLINGVQKEQVEIKLSSVTLKGTLLDENNLPIPYARVTVTGDNRSYSVNTDANGNYSFRLADGSYRISRVSDSTGDVSLNIPFDIVNGKLMVNGVAQEQITINLSPVTFKGIIKNSNNTPITSGSISLIDYKNSKWVYLNINSDGTFAGRLPDGDYYIYRSNAILLNQYFSIINGKIVINGQQVNELNLKLGNILNVKAVLKENGQIISNGEILIGYQDGIVSSGYSTDANGIANLSLQDGRYSANIVIKNGQWIYLTKPIIFEIKDGKLLVHGIEQDSLVVDINPQKPEVPSGLTVEAKEMKALHLKWNNQENATYYRVYRSLSQDGPYEEIAKVATNEFDDRNLDSSKTYWYKIIAGNDVGETEQSVAVSATTKAEVDRAGKLVKGNEALGNITFSFYSLGENQIWYDFTTDANGVFHYENLPDGDYKLEGVWVAPTWYVLNKTFTIKDGLINGLPLNFDVLDSQVNPPPPAEKNVVGSLLDGTKPLSDLIFSVHSLDGSRWYDTKTDSSGKFELTLPDGEFQLDGIWVDSIGKWYELNRKFTVKDGKLVESTELLINVHPLGNPNLTGTLYNGTDVLSNLVFSIRTAAGEEIWYNTETDQDGHFSFNLPDGTYIIFGIWDGSKGKWYELNQFFTMDNGVLVGAQELTINVNAPNKNYNVVGVLQKGSEVLSDIVFSIRTNSGAEIWYDTKTDGNGRFGFHLPDGSYKLGGIWIPSTGEWFELNQSFTVKGGQLDGASELSINVLETHNDNLTGTLKKESEIISNLVFSFHSKTDPTIWYDVKTDQNGQFSTKVPDGSYVIEGIWVEKEGKWYSLQKEFTVAGKLWLDIEF